MTFHVEVKRGQKRRSVWISESELLCLREIQKRICANIVNFDRIRWPCLFSSLTIPPTPSDEQMILETTQSAFGRVHMEIMSKYGIALGYFMKVVGDKAIRQNIIEFMKFVSAGPRLGLILKFVGSRMATTSLFVAKILLDMATDLVNPIILAPLNLLRSLDLGGIDGSDLLGLMKLAPANCAKHYGAIEATLHIFLV